MLQEHLPLITQQLEEELDAEQMEFLAEEAPEQVLTMLKTKGYFNGKVTVSRKGIGYLVSVDSGPQTKIDNVSVAILGDVLQDENLGAYYRSAMENWSLPVGATFSQEEWSGSKSSVLSAVRRKKYPLAEFSSTQATVDPTKHQADLSVSVDSGRPIYFGEFEISGNKRYPVSVVRGLAQFDTGSPYDLDKLLDYQQALEQDSHYSGASVQADFDRLEGDRVPVKVTVSEMKKHRLELGLSYDSEYGLGGKSVTTTTTCSIKAIPAPSSPPATNTNKPWHWASASRAKTTATTGQARLPTTAKPRKSWKPKPGQRACGMCATATTSNRASASNTSATRPAFPMPMWTWDTPTPPC